VTNPQDIADASIVAERERKTIPQFSTSDTDFDLDTAYRAEQAFVHSKLDAGERLVGYELGLTSRNKQQAMGVDAFHFTLTDVVADNASAGKFYLGPITRKPGEVKDLWRSHRPAARRGRRQCHLRVRRFGVNRGGRRLTSRGSV
jgi:2-keto-4-pentenoate hydratase